MTAGEHYQSMNVCKFDIVNYILTTKNKKNDSKIDKKDTDIFGQKFKTRPSICQFTPLKIHIQDMDFLNNLKQIRNNLTCLKYDGTEGRVRRAAALGARMKGAHR